MSNGRRQPPGWVLLLAAAGCFALMGVTVKQAVNTYHINIFQLGFLRFLIAATVIMIPAWLGAWPLAVVNAKYFLLRGFFGAAGNFLLFAVIVLIGLGRGTVMMQLMGVFGALSALLILHEKMSPGIRAATAISALGVLLCANLEWPSPYEYLAVLGAMCSGLALTFIRKLNQTESVHVIFFGQCICGVILLAAALPFVGFPTAAETWLAAGLVTLWDIAGQYLMTCGMIRTPVAASGLLLMLSPVISLLAGLLIYHEIIGPLPLAGCLLILSGGVLAVLKGRQ